MCGGSRCGKNGCRGERPRAGADRRVDEGCVVHVLALLALVGVKENYDQMPPGAGRGGMSLVSLVVLRESTADDVDCEASTALLPEELLTLGRPQT